MLAPGRSASNIGCGGWWGVRRRGRDVCAPRPRFEGHALLRRIGRGFASALRAARRTAAHHRTVLVDADVMLLSVRVGDFRHVERLASRGLLFDGADRTAL